MNQFNMFIRYYVKSKVVFFETKNGGRICMPIGDGYAPYIKTKDNSKEHAVRVYGVPPDAKFGDQIEVSLELMYHPKLDYGHLQPGTAFEILEGSKIIGGGIVGSAIYEKAVEKIA